MKFGQFLNIYKNVPLIDSATFPVYASNPSILRRQVRDWAKKKYLIPLKRGIYIFSENYRQVNLSNLFIANYIVSPSYISLDYALGYYSLIPERVTVLTSITTKKTNAFKNSLGIFEYRSIKQDLFFGFRKDKEENLEFFIAFPEKAILDYFYLNSKYKGKFEEFQSLRLQNLDILDIRRLNFYKVKFNKRVMKITDILIEYINRYKVKYKTL